MARQITTLQQLKTLVAEKRSVCVPDLICWARPVPAAVMMCQQGNTLLMLFETGMYLYEKKNTKRFGKK